MSKIPEDSYESNIIKKWRKEINYGFDDKKPVSWSDVEVRMNAEKINTSDFNFITNDDNEEEKETDNKLFGYIIISVLTFIISFGLIYILCK